MGLCLHYTRKTQPMAHLEYHVYQLLQLCLKVSFGKPGDGSIDPCSLYTWASKERLGAAIAISCLPTCCADQFCRAIDVRERVAMLFLSHFAIGHLAACVRPRNCQIKILHPI